MDIMRGASRPHSGQGDGSEESRIWRIASKMPLQSSQ